MSDIIADTMPAFLTALAAWIVFEIVGIAWLAKQLRDDMRQEDLEQQARLEKSVRARKTPANHGCQSS